MSRKPVSLAVHRNTVEKRRGKEQADNFIAEAKSLFRNQDVRAYALVAMDASGRLHALWDTGSVMPMWAFPSVMQRGLEVDPEQSGVEEDWKPSLPLPR